MTIVTVLDVKDFFLGGRMAITTPFLESHVREGRPGRIPIDALYTKWLCMDNIVALGNPAHRRMRGE